MKRLFSCLLVIIAILIVTGCPTIIGDPVYGVITTFDGYQITKPEIIKEEIQSLLSSSKDKNIKLVFKDPKYGSTWPAVDVSDIPGIQRIVSITLLDSVTAIADGTIENGTLKGFIGLKEFIAPNVETVGSYAFSNCFSLRYITLPEAITINQGSFRECIAIQNIDLLKAKTINEGAFFTCSSLKKVSLPEVTIIKNSAFFGCTSLSEIDIENVEYIEESSFSSCHKLKTIDLPNAINLGPFSFADCYSLKEINLPVVTKMDYRVFNSCWSLKGVTFGISSPEPTNGDYSNWGIFSYTKGSSSNLITIHVPTVSTGYDVAPWSSLAAETGITAESNSTVWGEAHNALKLVRR